MCFDKILKKIPLNLILIYPLEPKNIKTQMAATNKRKNNTSTTHTRGPTQNTKAYIDGLFERLCNYPRLTSVDDDGWVDGAELARTQKEKAPSTIKKWLLDDHRFEYKEEWTTRKIRLADPNLRLVTWKPNHSTQPPPTGVLEALFLACDAAVFSSVLPQWRWLYTLPLVCRKFRELLRPHHIMFLQCEKDHEPLICKKELTRIFGIQPNQYDELTFKIIYHARPDRQTHLAWRKDVLQLAVKKHHTTLITPFQSITNAYNARAARKANIAKERERKEEKAREMRVRKIFFLS